MLMRYQEIAEAIDVTDIEEELAKRLEGIHFDEAKSVNAIFKKYHEILNPLLMAFMKQYPIEGIKPNFEFMYDKNITTFEGMMDKKFGIVIKIPEQNIRAIYKNRNDENMIRRINEIFVSTISHELMHWLQFSKSNVDMFDIAPNMLYSKDQEHNIRKLNVLGAGIDDVYFGDKREIEPLAYNAAHDIIEWWMSEGDLTKTEAAQKAIESITERDHLKFYKTISPVFNAAFNAINDSVQPRATKLWKRFLREVIRQLELRL